MLSYLSSGVLPYIGPATARKIVQKFGDDTLSILSDTPQRLCEIKGHSPEKVATISREFRRLYGVRELITWFAQFNLSPQNAVSVYRVLGPHALEALQQNPYLLCGEPLQLKFKDADAIAVKLDVEMQSRLRMSAGILYALRRNANNGHTCLPREKLLQSTANFLKLDTIEDGLQELLDEGELRARTFGQTEYIFLPDMLSARRI